MRKERRIIIRKQLSSSQQDSDDRSDKNIQPAVKDIQYRKRRGERINYLIQKNEMYENQDEEEFWKSNKYFGGVEEVGQDDSYVQQDDAKLDSYDSDFGYSSEEEEQGEEEEEQQKRRKPDIQMKKQKSIKSEKKLKKERKEDDVSSHNSEQVQKKWYIHDAFNQEQMIREAVQTELKNKESLEGLIQMEEDKKKFRVERRSQIEGPRSKMTLSLNENGEPFSIIHYMDWKINIELKPRPKPAEKKFKYIDPKSKKGFNTIQQYRDLKKQQEKELQSLNDQIAKLESSLKAFSHS